MHKTKSKDFFVEKNMKSTEGFLKSLISIRSNIQSNTSFFVFRGLSNSHYKLQPSIYRENTIPKICRWGNNYRGIANTNNQELLIDFLIGETLLLENYLQESNHVGLNVPNSSFEFFNKITNINNMILDNSSDWLPKPLLDIAGIAQHYGTPTRLLDWSLNPLVAAYFASNKYARTCLASSTDEYISVWALNIGLIKYVNTLLEKLQLFHLMFKINIVSPQFCNNNNISAQKGVFTQIKYRFDFDDLYSINTIPETLDEHLKKTLKLIFESSQENRELNIINQIIEDNILVYKLNLSVKQIPKLRLILCALDFDSASLYPGYQGVSKYVLEMFGLG